jgi:hypothetical protein
MLILYTKDFPVSNLEDKVDLKEAEMLGNNHQRQEKTNMEYRKQTWKAILNKSPTASFPQKLILNPL